MIWVILLTVLATALVVLLLENFSTPEKKLESELVHRFSIFDEQFRREMSVLLGPSIREGNQVRALQNGDEIFPAMLEALRAAQHSITFETYIYWSGSIGERFAQALEARARAGVSVKLLLDWAGSAKMDKALLEQMSAAGVDVQVYRPLKWYNISRLNNRTHRKLLVLDGRVGFTGGVGIADHWLGHAQDAEHWRDMHFRIEGPVVAQLQAAFNDNWVKTSGQLLNGEDFFPALSAKGDMAAQVFVASPAGGSESMHLMYLMSLAAAEHSIDLQAAYFVPDALIIKALLAARKRGVRIRVILPGKHIDSGAVRAASKASWGELLQQGIEIYEYQPTMMHNKMLIADGYMVSVGSTNFDIRSFRLNDEASMNVYDRDFAAAITQVFERDLQSSRPYTFAQWQRRPFKEKFLETVVVPIRSQL